jgi:hypothetical protein
MISQVLMAFNNYEDVGNILINDPLNLRAALINKPSLTPLNFMFSHNFHSCYEPARQG